MLLRNTREPYDIVEHDNEDRIAFLKSRGYVEYIDMLAIIGEDPGATVASRRGKKSEPPVNLSDSALADALSKDE